ncbi:MAG: hypothetical protein E7394_08940 [Ruminococcaceae bacterium]|nr:hypothetical protein [Oscillospiraceae bacterium]
MKKVGIVDCYISNFHANMYYDLFKKIAKDEQREEYVITHIYASLDVSPANGETTDQWCERTGAKKCGTIKEVCDNVDVIMVLAPNNPELHEELVKLPFESGKLCYVDKTFAPDFATAKRIKEYGNKFGARYWSSSAVRFDPELDKYLGKENPEVKSILVQGGNVFKIYSIHLVEVMNTVMKGGADFVKCIHNDNNLMFEITYKDGRKCFYHQTIGIPTPFAVYVDNGEACEAHVCGEEFWYTFARALMDFFDTGVAKVNINDTLECIAVRSALMKAMENVGEVVKVEE